MQDRIGHVPVLVDETCTALDPRPGQHIIDATIGRGGHALEIAKAVGPGGRVIGVDRDRENLAFAERRIRDTGVPFEGIHASFAQLPTVMRERGLAADGLLADLGISSTQLDDPARGFGFTGDGPLDMRLDPTTGPTASDLLASMTTEELADVIYQYGEDPFARKIARKLTQARDVRPIGTTAQLAQLVKEAYGHRAHSSRLHPATRTFMALRIAVNDELAALEALLEAIRAQATETSVDRWLRATARVVIISFHSLEDRRVKHWFMDLHREGLAERLTRKPVMASETEIRNNPRARSAKLRAITLRDSRREPDEDNDR